MRLYDTFTRAKRELPEPPGPIRMYFCGPTVYARAHIGNARPFVVGMWLARWLRAARLRRGARPQHHGHQRQDLRRGAGSERRARRARDASGTSRTPADLGLGMPDDLPRATEVVPQIVAFIEGLVERGFAYEVDGDVYFRVARVPGLRAALGPASRPGRGAGAERAQGGSARLRALEGEQARRGHVRGTRRGAAAGRAGTSSAP